MKIGIRDSIQFGEGNFLRAFVEYCIQALNEKTSFSGKVDIVQPISEGMIEQLKKQNGKYHLYHEGVLQGKNIRKGQLIECIDKMINPYQEIDNFLKLAENEKIKISSYNIIYEVLDYNKSRMSGLLAPDIQETISGIA